MPGKRASPVLGGLGRSNAPGLPGELVGNYKNPGREWQPTGAPVEVDVHDFPDPTVGKAIPYGVYDVATNTGWVTVGRNHDTAAFAVATLRAWWRQVGRPTYPNAARLLISADSGGSNGSRLRLGKVELAKLAADTGLAITVCRLPPATSKWNKIEHRMFAHISMNWRGRPLEGHEAVVALIGATTTRTGLTVHAELDESTYPKGVKITDRQMAALPLTRLRLPPRLELHPRTRPRCTGQVFVTCSRD